MAAVRTRSESHRVGERTRSAHLLIGLRRPLSLHGRLQAGEGTRKKCSQVSFKQLHVQMI